MYSQVNSFWSFEKTNYFAPNQEKYGKDLDTDSKKSVRLGKSRFKQQKCWRKLKINSHKNITVKEQWLWHLYEWLGAKWCGKKLVGWMTAGAIGYEVSNQINKNEEKIINVNITIIKTVDSSEKSELNILLIFVIISVLLMLLSFLAKILWEMKKYKSNKRNTTVGIHMRNFKPAENNRSTEGSHHIDVWNLK